MKNNILSLILVSMLSTGGFCQVINSHPNPGDTISSFAFTEVLGKKTGKITSTQLRGKPYILVFWTTGCFSSIESLQKADQLQRNFKGQVQFLFVGKDYLGANRVAEARRVFTKYQKEWNLIIPMAIDTFLFNEFKPADAPACYWVNKNGIIITETSVSELNDSNVKSFLKGEPFPKKADEDTRDSNPKNSQLYNKRDTLMTSSLMQWTPDIPMYGQSFISSTAPKNWASVKKNKITMVGCTLKELYALAFGDTISPKPPFYHSKFPEVFAQSSYGNWWVVPVLETKDSSMFDGDYKTGRNYYSYQLRVPLQQATTTLLQTKMQTDLRLVFGYHVQVETRDMPCWLLTTDAEHCNSLASGGGQKISYHAFDSLYIRNLPVSELIFRLWQYLPEPKPPIIDDTGIDGNIDITISAAMTDMHSVKSALQRAGIKLVPGRRAMKVIVIRDRVDSLPRL